jgi:hypothetical protein
MITTGEALTRALRVRGVDALYGTRREGIEVVEVDAAVAPIVVAAHRRVHGQPAAFLDGDWLRLGDGPEVLIDDAGAVEAVMGAGSVRLDVDLLAPTADVVPAARPPVDRWLDPDPGVIAAVVSARAPAALIGPGVVDQRAVPGLHALATALSIGVLNTWGAKGVFDWRSRHHFATVGLQARDFDLGGLGSADLLLTSGLDLLEAGDLWRLAPSVDVAPSALGPLAQGVSRPWVELGVPPLRTGLAAVTQAGWAQPAAPLAPTRVTLHYGQVFGAGGLVAADPGTAGYWVARTFSTTELGSAIVPADRGASGFALACALVARLRRPARAVLAVTDEAASAGRLVDAAGRLVDAAGSLVDAAGSLVDAAGRLLDAAARLGVAIPVEVWEPGGPALDADAHLARLRRMAVAERSLVERIGTDPTQLVRMIGVAGPVIAWGGL